MSSTICRGDEPLCLKPFYVEVFVKMGGDVSVSYGPKRPDRPSSDLYNEVAKLFGLAYRVKVTPRALNFITTKASES